MVSVIMHPLYN